MIKYQHMKYCLDYVMDLSSTIHFYLFFFGGGVFTENQKQLLKIFTIYDLK